MNRPVQTKVFFQKAMNLLDNLPKSGNNLKVVWDTPCARPLLCSGPVVRHLDVFRRGFIFVSRYFSDSLAARYGHNKFSGSCSMSSDNHICEQVLFTGHVQGVGFRYCAYQVAQSYDVRGWVRNLPNGSVEMKISGPNEEVDGCVAEIQERMASYIRLTNRNSASPDFSMTGFEVRR